MVRRSLMVLALLASSSVALAQQQEWTFKVTTDEINTISNGLETQPYGKVVQLINKLRSQLLEQQQPKATEDKPPAIEPEKK